MQYYGYRSDWDRDFKGKNAMPYWQRNVYAGVKAAINAPNLTRLERMSLLNAAAYWADYAGLLMRITPEIKDILWGEGEYMPPKGRNIAEYILFVPMKASSYLLKTGQNEKV